MTPHITNLSQPETLCFGYAELCFAYADIEQVA